MVPSIVARKTASAAARGLHQRSVSSVARVLAPVCRVTSIPGQQRLPTLRSYSSSSGTTRNDAQPPSTADVASAAASAAAGSVGVDAFTVSNVFVSGIPLFSGSGMMIVRAQPAAFEIDSGRLVCSSSGCLRLAFYPCHEQEPNRFDTTRKFQFGIRGIDVGSILETDLTKLAKVPVIVPGFGGILEIGPASSGTEGLVVLRGVPTRKQQTQPDAVEVEITSGQFKTLQTVITHVAPSLFGWQVLIDPKLASCFIPNNDWLALKRPKPLSTPDEEVTTEFFSSATESV